MNDRDDERSARKALTYIRIAKLTQDECLRAYLLDVVQACLEHAAADDRPVIGLRRSRPDDER